MKIYTRKGDDGQTHLCSGPRVAKDDPHIEACGAVDELNALLGLGASPNRSPADIDSLLHRVQHELFSVGADLAMPGPDRRATPACSADEHVEQLEREIDLFDAQLPPLTEFILPGGSRASALLHCARTVCRRAERRVVSLVGSATEPAAGTCAGDPLSESAWPTCCSCSRVSMPRRWRRRLAQRAASRPDENCRGSDRPAGSA